MIGLFKEFDELFDSVIDILVELQRDELMTPLLDYFKDEEAEYMHYLQVLDNAVANLGRSVPPVWEPFQGSVKVLEKCTKNLIGHSRLAFNNHESNIDC